MHTSVVTADASRQEPGPRRRLPHVQIKQERSRSWVSARSSIVSRAGGCRFAWSSTQTTTNSYSCQSQRT